MMGTDAAAAALLAEPAKLCRSTMQSAYPSMVLMVSATASERYAYEQTLHGWLDVLAAPLMVLNTF